MKKVKRITLAGNIIINKKKEIFLLYRIKHQFYETPGGKLRVSECRDMRMPTLEELKQTAQRELFEEVDGIKEIISMEYFGKINFKVPDGRKAVAHKFITKVKGNLYAGEKIFDKNKSMFIYYNKLEEYPLSRDLRLLLPRIKKYFEDTNP